jgi:hypothetical protein
LVEHATENRSVGGSIPPLGTTPFPFQAEKYLQNQLFVVDAGATWFRHSTPDYPATFFPRLAADSVSAEILPSVSHHQGVAGMRGKLTKRSVDALKSDVQDQFTRDTEIHGCGCKITPRTRISTSSNTDGSVAITG